MDTGEINQCVLFAQVCGN